MPEFADQRTKISGFPLYTTFFVLAILLIQGLFIFIALNTLIGLLSSL